MLTYNLSKVTPKEFYKKYPVKIRFLSIYSLRFVSDLNVDSVDLGKFKERNDCFKKYSRLILIFAGLSLVCILVWMLYQLDLPEYL